MLEQNVRISPGSWRTRRVANTWMRDLSIWYGGRGTWMNSALMAVDNCVIMTLSNVGKCG